MSEIKFSIGYNHDLQVLRLLEAAKDYVESLYFPIPYSYTGSGRALPQDKGYPNEIKEIIRRCGSFGIKSLLLVNAACEGRLTANKEHMNKVVNYVLELKDLGLNGVIITNPMYIAEIKKNIADLEIHSSVNCYTRTVEQAVDLKEMGVDVLTIDRDINRDLDLIKEIKERTGLKIKALVNEGCLRNCPFRMAHFNAIAHQADTSEFDKRSCITVLRRHPEKFFKIPFIRPEDLRRYKGLVDYFKIATRTMDSVKIGVILDAYVSERFEGDLLFLLSGKGIFEYFNDVDNRILEKRDFFNKITSCDEDCEGCDYCSDLLKKAASINEEYL